MKEYNLKFIQLSKYASETISDMRANMRKLVSGLGKHVKREWKASFLISDMDSFKLMMYAQHVEEDKKRDREEHLSKKAKSVGHEPNQKQGKDNRSFQKRPSGYAASLTSAPTPRNRYEQKLQNHQNFRAQGSQSQGTTQDSKGKPPCGKCCILHLDGNRESVDGCYKCDQMGHFLKECPMWRQSDGGKQGPIFFSNTTRSSCSKRCYFKNKWWFKPFVCYDQSLRLGKQVRCCYWYASSLFL